MEIQTVEILEDGSFLVNKNISQGDDRQVTIPDNMSNRHRRKLQLWIDAGNTPDPFVAPVPTWEDNRTGNKASGGYGTSSEQFEILGEDGMEAYQSHINAVKLRYPKS